VGSSVGVSDSGSTLSFEKALGGIALGGSAGRDFSATASFSRAFACALDFFLRLAIRDSWQLMQNMPCEVLA
jgi:hypothetical protein